MHQPRTITPPPRKPRQDGIALISVFWLIALLTVLAASLLATVKNHGRVTQQTFQRIEADVLLDSALRLALIELAAPPDQIMGSTWSQGMSRSVRVGTSYVAVDVQLEAGRIDINAASEDLLFAYFAANEFDEREARALASGIVEWREAGGTLMSGFGATGLLSRQAPFQSTEELRQVEGLSQLSDELLDGLTVFTRSTEVLGRAAPDRVKKALAWADTKLLGGRSWSSQGAASINTPLIGEVVRVKACTSEFAYCKEAVARLTGNLQRPLHIFDWRSRVQTSDGSW